jgi:uncharacterized membrane protein
MIDTKGSKVVLYIETCASLDDAKADFEIVKQVHRDGLLGIYDAAIVSKDATGQVKIHRNELPTQYGAWSGLAVGALVGIFFPPYLVWELAGGLVAGALIGHFWGGMSGADLKEIGERLQKSSAAVIVIGRSKVHEVLAKSIKHAASQLEREIDTDAAAFEKTLNEALDQVLQEAK